MLVELLLLLRVGRYTAGVRCFHAKAALHNHVEVSGFAVALGMPAISVVSMMQHGMNRHCLFEP